MLGGFPDFGYQLQEEAFWAFAPYEASDHITVVPRKLEIGRTANGQMALFLESVRTTNPFSQLSPLGLLDIQFQLASLQREVIEDIRLWIPDKEISYPYFNGGYLRFEILEEGREDSLVPLSSNVPLSTTSYSRIRYTQQLPFQTVNTLKKTLSAGILLANAQVVLPIKGIAPRVKAKVSFDPAPWLEKLYGLVDEQDRIAESDLLVFFEENILDVSIQPQPEEEEIDRDVLIETFMMRWCMRFCKPAPMALGMSEPYWYLEFPADFESGQFVWDLGKPNVVIKQFYLSFDAFAEAQKIIQAEGGIHSIYHETIIRDLPTGYLRVVLSHPFHDLPEGVITAGLKITAPTNIPYRSRAINETVLFDPTGGRAVTNLRFSPRETPSYYFTPFLIYQETGKSREIEGETYPSEEGHVRINLSHFPLELIPVTATRGLLDLCQIRGILKWSDETQLQELHFSLDKQNPEKTLALPKGMLESATIQIHLQDETSSASIQKTFQAGQQLNLTRLDFKEYGPQSIEIHYPTGSQSPLIVVELIPEAVPLTADNITTITLTPDDPIKTWTWFSKSLFSPGFRFRMKMDNQDMTDWSEVQSPFVEVLDLSAGISARQLTDMPMLIGESEFENIRYFQSRNEESVFYYLPLHLMPQKDTAGHPSLSLIIHGENSFFMLGVEWTPAAEVLERLRVKIIHDYRDFDPSLIRLAPAAVKSIHAELILHTESGKITLGSSKPSTTFPCSAIFNTSLTLDQTNLVMAALHQRENVLEVQYTVEREIPAYIQVVLNGELSQVPFKGATPDLPEVIEWLKQAVQDQWLTLELETNLKEEDALLSEATLKIYSLAAKQILDKLLNATESEPINIHAELKFTETKDQTFLVATDISSWFEGREGDNHIKIVS